MSPRVSPRPREAESSFAEFRSKLQSNGHYFPTADRDLLFWRYLTEGGPIVEEFGHERLATLGEEEHRTLSKATGPAGGFLVPTDFADSIETARRARNVIAAVSRVIETDHGRALERAFAGPAYVDRGLVFADALGGPIHPAAADGGVREAPQGRRPPDRNAARPPPHSGDARAHERRPRARRRRSPRRHCEHRVRDLCAPSSAVGRARRRDGGGPSCVAGQAHATPRRSGSLTRRLLDAHPRPFAHRRAPLSRAARARACISKRREGRSARTRYARGVPPTDAARSDEFDAVVEEYHRALDAFITGEPGPMKWLFSRRDDVTLANPFGPPRRGRSEVEETLERAASQLRDGRGLHFEQVSKYVTPELAYIVEFERVPEVKVGGSNEVSRVSLRVTTIFRREDDGWKVVHRQADPITGPRPPESIIEK